MTKSTDSVDAHIGGRVRLRRMTIGMSQEQLGDALHLTFQQVQKYEKGLNRIGAGRLYRIGQILSVPVEYFYEGLPSAAGPNPTPDADKRGAEVMAFLSTAEGYSLSTAFSQIDDAPTRRRLVDLVRTIAQQDAG